MDATFLHKVTAYCLAEISLDDLRLWIAENSEIIFESPDSEECSLVAAIEDIVVQAAELDADELFIRSSILSRLPNPILVYPVNEPYRIESGSTGSSIRSETISVWVSEVIYS